MDGLKQGTGKMSVFIRLVDFKDSDEKERQFFNKENWFTANQNDFQKIPGAPIAYWINHKYFKIFDNKTRLEEIAPVRQGFQTGDNERFLRYWYEIEKNKRKVDALSVNEAINSGLKWFPYNKGGPFRRWFGNNEFLVAFDKESYKILEKSGNCLPSRNYYFKEGITWSSLSSSIFGARYSPSGFTFSAKGACAFPKRNYLNLILALLNSSVVSKLFEFLSATLDFNVGPIKQIPIIFPDKTNLGFIEKLANSNKNISKEEWDSRETSWDFQQNELLRHKTSGRIEDAYRNYCDYWREKFFQLHANEEELNRIFIEIYGLQDELTPEVALKDITILKEETEIIEGKSEKVEGKSWEEIVAQLHSPERREALKERLKFKKAEIIKQFISYAVGCMFGRYSPDKPGLILANQGETLQDYLQQVPNPTFMPDADNIIPVLEDAYFTDDIVGRFQEFLKVSFGEAHLEENLRFIEGALGKSIRQYFVRDFYKDHVRRYKKRSIYWMFSSPKRGFNALIYMHRYRPDTVSRLLNEYLREFINKLEARQRHLKNIYLSESSSVREKKAADKELTRIERLLKELRDYERNVLYPLAARKIEIDLDDGVKVNYCKFGEALYPIPGLCKEK